MSWSPIVSVIVTTRNEEDVIERLLKSIKRQTYPRVEILVVDNASSDRTKRIASKYVTKVYDKGPERSTQRNFGAQKAKGRYLLFLDADMQLSKNVIKEGVRVLKSNPKIGAATIIEKSVAVTFWERVKAYERSFYNLEGDETSDAARFFKREIFEKVGGYDEMITGPEDWDLTDKVKKVGWKLAVVKTKIYHYERIRSLFSLMKKKYYYALKSYKYFRKHGISPLSPKTIYFFRPVFYRNWRIIIANPILSLSMFFMLLTELLSGALGYIVGRIFK